MLVMNARWNPRLDFCRCRPRGFCSARTGVANLLARVSRPYGSSSSVTHTFSIAKKQVYLPFTRHTLSVRADYLFWLAWTDPIFPSGI